MVLEGSNAVRLWRDMLGPTDPARARHEMPLSLRARFGGVAMPDNAFHGSDSLVSAVREIALFFPELA
jgi:nucleoside diphosphate kinase